MGRKNKEEGYDVATDTLGTRPSDPLASDLGLELYRTTMSMVGVHGGRLDINRER